LAGQEGSVNLDEFWYCSSQASKVDRETEDPYNYKVKSTSTMDILPTMAGQGICLMTEHHHL